MVYRGLTLSYIAPCARLLPSPYRGINIRPWLLRCIEEAYLVWQRGLQYAASQHPLHSRKRWAGFKMLQEQPTQLHLCNSDSFTPAGCFGELGMKFPRPSKAVANLLQ